MDDNNETPVPPKHPQRRRRVRRWLGRMVRWSVILAGTAAVIAAISGYLVYRNRAQVVNYGLRELVRPYAVSVEHIDVLESGVLRLKGVKIAAAPDLPDIASFPEISVEYSWDQLKARHLGKVVVKDPVIRVSDAHLQPSSKSVGGKIAGTRVGLAEGRKRALQNYFVGGIQVTGGDIQIALGGLPEVSLTIDVETGPLEFGGSGELSPEPVMIQVQDFRARPPGAGDEAKPFATAGEITLQVRPRADMKGGSIDIDRLINASVEVTPALRPPEKPAPGAPGPQSQEKAESIPGLSQVEDAGGQPGEWTLNSAELSGIQVSVRGFGNAESQPVLPDIALSLSLELKDLLLGGGERAVRSSEVQLIDLEDVFIRGGSDEDEKIATRVAWIEAQVVPDDLVRSGLIRKLHVHDPLIEITSETILRFLPAEVAEELAVDDAVVETLEKVAREEDKIQDAEKTEAGEVKVFVVKDLALEGGQIAFDPGGIQEGLPIASGILEITTAETSNADAPAGRDPKLIDATYHAVLSDLDFKDPKIVQQELATGQRIEIDFSARGLQVDRQIGRIELVGFSLLVGDSLRGLVEAQSAGAGKGGKSTAGGAAKGWGIGEFSIRESRVFIQDLMPGLPMVSFEFHTPEALTGLAFAGDKKTAEDLVQRVELSGLEIRSPYDSLTTVASLPDIFIEFTLGELTGQRRIRRVQVLNPELWVGEHLFWYIDNLRRVEGELKVDEAIAATKLAAGSGGGANPVAGGDAAPPEWTIETIDIESGKLIVAPKGFPIGFTPFPFSGSTDLTAGTIDLKLEIPEGDYSYPEMELEFVDLKGVIEFNLPNKDKNNNLYQRLEMGKLRFQKYEIDKAFLEITFDELGVYSRYGGEAYKTEGFQGWVNGEANFYLGEIYRWDGWVAATEVSLDAITRLIAPETVRMKGVLDAKLVAKGRQLKVESAGGDLQMLTPGHLNIPALDKLLKQLPEAWSKLERNLAGIGIEALKDFDFNEGSGKLEYTGDRGSLKMDLIGPDGARSVDLRFQDLSSRGLNFDILNASNP